MWLNRSCRWRSSTGRRWRGLTKENNHSRTDEVDAGDRLLFSMRRLSPFSAILTGGAIAGALDITYAIGFSALRGVAPVRILQSVSSGLLGASAFEGGTATAALGLLLHFCIAFLWAAIFYLASKAIPILTRHSVVAGLFYGVLIYAVMNLVVLPFSAFPGKVSFPGYLSPWPCAVREPRLGPNSRHVAAKAGRAVLLQGKAQYTVGAPDGRNAGQSREPAPS